MLNKELTRNEILGLVNFLVGMSQVWTVFKVIPEMQGILESFGQIGFSNVAYAFSIVIAIANIFVGISLFKKNKADSVFNTGLIILIGSILILPLIYTLTVILPIYDLTNSL